MRSQTGVAARASDIDVIYVNGYGFPAWRGGPLLYADLMGLARGPRADPCVPSRIRRTGGSLRLCSSSSSIADRRSASSIGRGRG